MTLNRPSRDYMNEDNKQIIYVKRERDPRAEHLLTVVFAGLLIMGIMLCVVI